MRASERMLVQGWAMLEHHCFTGTDVSPRAALNCALHPAHTLRFSVSQAYRSPTFYELDGNVAERDIDGVLVNRAEIPSATQLEPERLLSREIGYVGHNFSGGVYAV